jgi:hypothetical protein
MVASPPVALTKGVASETIDFTATRLCPELRLYGWLSATPVTVSITKNMQNTILHPTSLFSSVYSFPFSTCSVGPLLIIFSDSTISFRFSPSFPSPTFLIFSYFPCFILLLLPLFIIGLLVFLLVQLVVCSFETGSRKFLTQKAAPRLDSTEFKLSGYIAVRGIDA